MTATSVVPSKFEDYEKFLWKVLARLASDGYVVLPQNAKDYIHDFYVEAWPKITKSYNPDLGKFTTYLASAFYKFCRRRVIYQHNLDRKLEAFDESLFAQEEGSRNIQETHCDTSRVKLHLDRLNSFEKEVITEYVNGYHSERMLSERFKVSRYAIKKNLVNAIGKLAASFHGELDSKHQDKYIAYLIWIEGRPLKDIAILIGKPLSTVRSEKQNYVNQIILNLKSISAKS